MRRKDGVDVADLEILRAHAFSKTREFLLAHPEYRPSASQKRRLTSYMTRRKKHEPVALIIKRKPFFDIDLEVAHGVLIPRPETELLVEEALALTRGAGDAARGSPVARSEASTVGVSRGRRKAGSRSRDRTRVRPSIIDVGTGSGAIALALAKHLPGAQIIATDISSQALSLARRNARRLGLSRRARFVHADLLPQTALGAGDAARGSPVARSEASTVGVSRGRRKAGSRSRDRTRASRLIIVANLPYLPTDVWKKTPPDVKRFEPRSALDGGPDGLSAYRRLFAMIADRGAMNHAPTMIIIEIDPSQKKTLPAVVRGFFPKAHLTFKKDLAGKWRVVVITHCRP